LRIIEWKRQAMLKILATSLYDIEEHSSLEAITEFKAAYKEARETLSACLHEFFSEFDDKRTTNFVDTFMASPQYVSSLYARSSSQADVCVVEGMMGLFDGYDRELGSSADIAILLDLPVILVVDARSAAYSTAALISGFMGFRRHLRIAGIIFNQVGSARHREILQQVCEDLSVECLGFLPKSAELATSSRYLGLDFSETPEAQPLLAAIDENIAWRRLLELTTKLRPVYTPLAGSTKQSFKGRVAVARNKEAFSFIYQDNLRVLGSDLVFFDPEQDEALPSDISLLYLPGGYPEKHAQALAAASRSRQSILDYAKQGALVHTGFRGNAMLFALPIAQGIFGSDVAEITIVLAVVVLINNVCAVPVLEHYRNLSYVQRGLAPKESTKFSLGKTLKGWFSTPLLDGVVLGVIWSAFKIPMPAVCAKVITNLAGTVVPLAFIVLGARMSLDHLKANSRNVIIIVFTRLFVLPGIFLIYPILAGWDEKLLVGVLVAFGAPSAVVSYAMTEAYDLDGEMAGEVVTLTSFFAIFSLFIWIFCFKQFGLIS